VDTFHKGVKEGATRLNAMPLTRSQAKAADAQASESTVRTQRRPRSGSGAGPATATTFNEDPQRGKKQAARPPSKATRNDTFEPDDVTADEIIVQPIGSQERILAVANEAAAQPSKTPKRGKKRASRPPAKALKLKLVRKRIQKQEKS